MVANDTKTRRVRKFTPGRKRAFTELIAAGYSPTHAAKELGVSRQAAYQQRKNDPDFAERWGEALEEQADLYEDALRRAAIEQKNIGGIIFGLKNLRSTKWKDRHEVDVDSRNLTITAQLPAGAEADIMAYIAARETDRLASANATGEVPALLPSPTTDDPDDDA